MRSRLAFDFFFCGLMGKWICGVIVVVFGFCRDSGSRRILSSVTFGLTLVNTDG